MLYREYVSSILRYGQQGKTVDIGYIELLNKKVDNRTGEEIASEVIKNAGLKFGRKEE